MGIPATTSPTREERQRADGLYFVVHPSFLEPKATALYGPSATLTEHAGSYMPDEVTRECSRRMHYAAWRMSREKSATRRAVWKNHYIAMRDLVVLGNRKLVFRAVRRWMSNPSRSDDMISDCQIVMIQSVAAFNPWLGIRFSTYAFTCLMRALSRMSQKNQGDRLAKSLPLETISDTEQASLSASEPGSRHQTRVDLYLKEDNTLLSDREKQVLIRRFRLDDRQKAGTREQVGKELGLSKERVRQVQTTALDKLRMVLSALDGI